MEKMELIWCCWHNTIISWWNYRERVEEIKEIKPIDQWGARFASMAVVKNPDKIPAEVIGACKNFSEAEEAFDKAEEAESVEEARRQFEGKAEELRVLELSLSSLDDEGERRKAQLRIERLTVESTQLEARLKSLEGRDKEEKDNE